jgi:hypothetical protein
MRIGTPDDKITLPRSPEPAKRVTWPDVPPDVYELCMNDPAYRHLFNRAWFAQGLTPPSMLLGRHRQEALDKIMAGRAGGGTTNAAVAAGPAPKPAMIVDASTITRADLLNGTFERKRALLEQVLADKPARPLSGEIRVSRIDSRGVDPGALVLLPEPPDGRRFSSGAERGFFDYATRPGDKSWTLNFADPDPFAYAKTPLFAQDEIQSLEHPALIAIGERWRLESRGLIQATPLLLENVERLGAVDASGCYGNAFADPRNAAWSKAMTTLSPPTRSDLIAMAATPVADGALDTPYGRSQIAGLFTRAYAAFSGAKALSGDARCVVSTGNWGCGAFGNNPELVARVQLLAADVAGVDVLRYFAGPAARAYTNALQAHVALKASGEPIPVADVLEALFRRGYRWGRSDGN